MLAGRPLRRQHGVAGPGSEVGRQGGRAANRSSPARPAGAAGGWHRLGADAAPGAVPAHRGGRPYRRGATPGGGCIRPAARHRGIRQDGSAVVAAGRQAARRAAAADRQRPGRRDLCGSDHARWPPGVRRGRDRRRRGTGRSASTCSTRAAERWPGGCRVCRLPYMRWRCHRTAAGSLPAWHVAAHASGTHRPASRSSRTRRMPARFAIWPSIGRTACMSPPRTASCALMSRMAAKRGRRNRRLVCTLGGSRYRPMAACSPSPMRTSISRGTCGLT